MTTHTETDGDRWNNPFTGGGTETKAHFARPAGGFTTATKPFTCVVCGQPVEQDPKRWRIWRHVR